MKSAAMKIIMVSTKLLVLIILLFLAGTQLVLPYVDTSRFYPFSPPNTAPQETISFITDVTIEIPDAIESKGFLVLSRPRQTLVGWIIILVSSLLLLEGLDAKFIRSSLCIL
jgi:hypothetical protein